MDKINDNIFLEGYNISQIEALLKKWILKYKEDLEGNIEFKIFENKSNKFMISINGNISNFHFYFLVNYLSNPNKNVNPNTIVGYCIGKNSNILKNVTHLVYTSANDSEGDNVYCVTSNNENFKIDFGGKVIPIKDNLSYYAIDSSSYVLLRKIYNVEKVISQYNNKGGLLKQATIHKRAKIVFIVFSSVLLLSVILLLIGFDLLFLNKLITLVSGLFSLWLYIDEKILQQQFNIRMSFLLGIIGFIVNILIYSITIQNKMSFLFLIGHTTLVFIPFQIVLRKTYLKLFRKEPIIVGIAGNFPEFVYSTILMFYLLIVPLLIGEYIKKLILCI
ncbi:MAG: hypothetical protein R2774_16240 [Saprospiraceae bacterium]